MSSNANIQLLDSDGDRLSGSYNPGRANENGVHHNLPVGEYYLKVYGGDTNYNLNFELLGDSDAMDSLLTAKDLGTISGKQTQQGTVSKEDRLDIYQFSTDKIGDLNYQLTGLSSDANIQLLDSDGTMLSGSFNPYRADENQVHEDLPAGEYYLKVYGGGTDYNLDFQLLELGIIDFDGTRRGDIIKVDLKQSLPEGATAKNWKIDDFGVGGEILQDGGNIVSANGQTFEESGVFYFIPTIDTPPQVREALKADGLLQVGGESKADGLLTDASGPEEATTTFSAELNDTNNPGQIITSSGMLEIEIEDDYSAINLTNPVGKGGINDTLDVARVQQRLRYFNYPDFGLDGPPDTGNNSSQYPLGKLVEVDGDAGNSTYEAISLFEAAITNYGRPKFSKGKDATSDGLISSGDDSLQWLNNSNAPRWVELIDTELGGNFDISRCNTTETLKPCTAQWERFGTHWTVEYIQLVTSQVNKTQVITAISEYGHTELHTTHKGGHDIDVAYGGQAAAPSEFAAVDFSINTSSQPADPDLRRQYYLDQLQTEISQETDPTKKAGLELVKLTVEEILAFYDTVGADLWNGVFVGENSTDLGYKLIREVLSAIDSNLNPKSAPTHGDHYHIGTKPQNLETA